ncbi:MAG TPA: hypothetical protein PLR30_11030 [Saprospiraceae bacterium]|nr:hypothetical protein [Saprospiraceae bacterium]
MMELVDFITSVDNHLKRLANGSLKLKGLKSLAYELAEKDHVALEGKRKFSHYTSFSNSRTKKFGKTKEIVIDKDMVKVTAMKRKQVYRRTEFDSKFNWLF